MKDKKEVTQIRDSLLEDYNGLRKDKNPAENFETQEAVLAAQINVLSYILGHSFNLFTGKVQKIKNEETPANMFTYQKDGDSVS